MLFRIEKKNERQLLQAVSQSNEGRFLENTLELLLTSTDDDGRPNSALLDENVFGERLYLIGRQFRTRQDKRLDVLALDERGRAVVIELKRDHAILGVDTQALQYLADVSAYSGEEFLDKYLEDRGNGDRKRQILDALEVPPDEINRKQRIILIARSFDPSLYSMGEWLASQGISFRCIRYGRYTIGDQDMLTFAVAFDRAAEPVYRIRQSERVSRGPASFWLGTGSWVREGGKAEQWWRAHVEGGFVSCGFDGRLDDRGTEILDGMLRNGDTVFAYMPGVGAIGYGVVNGPYKLWPPSDQDPLGNEHLHRRPVRWKVWLDPSSLLDGHSAIRPADLRSPELPSHPIATAARIRDERKAEALRRAMDQRADANPGVWKRREA